MERSESRALIHRSGISAGPKTKPHTMQDLALRACQPLPHDFLLSLLLLPPTAAPVTSAARSCANRSAGAVTRTGGIRSPRRMRARARRGARSGAQSIPQPQSTTQSGGRGTRGRPPNQRVRRARREGRGAATARAATVTAMVRARQPQGALGGTHRERLEPSAVRLAVERGPPPVLPLLLEPLRPRAPRRPRVTEPAHMTRRTCPPPPPHARLPASAAQRQERLRPHDGRFLRHEPRLGSWSGLSRAERGERGAAR